MKLFLLVGIILLLAIFTTSQLIAEYSLSIYLDASFVPQQPVSTPCGLDKFFPCTTIQQAFSIASSLQNGSSNGSTIFYFKPGNYYFETTGAVLLGNLTFVGEQQIVNPLAADWNNSAVISSVVPDTIVFQEPLPFIYSPNVNTNSSYTVQFQNLIFLRVNYPLFRPPFVKNSNNSYSIYLTNCLLDTYRGTMIRTADIDDSLKLRYFLINLFELQNVAVKSNILKPNDVYFSSTIDISFYEHIRFNRVTFYNISNPVLSFRNDADVNQLRSVVFDDVSILYAKSFNRFAFAIRANSFQILSLTTKYSSVNWESYIRDSISVSNLLISDCATSFKVFGTNTFPVTEAFFSSIQVFNSTSLYDYYSPNTASAILEFSTLQSVTVQDGLFVNNTANDGQIRITGVELVNITNCNFDTQTSTRSGAISLRFSFAIIQLCSFRNINSVNGAGISAELCSILKIANCTFESNQGSAIYLDSVFNRQKTALDFGAIISNSQFYNNHAKRGAALFLTYQVLLQINSCQFYNNTASEDGGVIYSNANSVKQFLSMQAPGFVVRNSQFWNNEAKSRGGVIYTVSPKSIYNFAFCEFRNNKAYTGGVAYYDVNDSVQMIDSQFIQNSATTNGGCITIVDARLLTLQRCYLFRCSANQGNGGAIYSVASDMLLSNVQAVENYATNGSTIATKTSHLNYKRIVADKLFMINNTAQDSGTIYLEQFDRLSMSDSLFDSNRAFMSAGLTIIGSCSTIFISRTTFSNNTAKSYSILYQVIRNLQTETVCNMSSWTAVINADNSQPDIGTNPQQWSLILEDYTPPILLGDTITVSLKVYDALQQEMKSFYDYTVILQSKQLKLFNQSTEDVFTSNSFTNNQQHLQVLGIIPSAITQQVNVSASIYLQNELLGVNQLVIPLLPQCPYKEDQKQIIDYIPYSGFYECVSATCNYINGTVARIVFSTFSLLMVFFIIFNSIHYLIWIVILIRQRVRGFVPSFWPRIVLLLSEFVLHCLMFIVASNYLFHNIGLLNSDSASWVKISYAFDVLNVIGITLYTNVSYVIAGLYFYHFLQLIGNHFEHFRSFKLHTVLLVLVGIIFAALTLFFIIGFVVSMATINDWLYSTTSTVSYTVSFFFLWLTTLIGYLMIVILFLSCLLWYYYSLFVRKDIKQLLFTSNDTTIQIDANLQKNNNSSFDTIFKVYSLVVAPFGMVWGIIASRSLFVVLLSISECRIGIFFGLYAVLSVLSLPLPSSIVTTKPLPSSKRQKHPQDMSKQHLLLRDSWQDFRSMLPEAYLLQFDQLQIVSQLGSGAQGTVYLCEYSGAKVAAKMFAINYMGHADLDQFYREAATLLQYANHPNIIRLIGVCEDKNSVCIVTEYCKNGNLGMYLEQHASEMDFKLKCSILEGISAGMKHLHHIPIIHRDLKCENILLDDSLQPKIADFGFSKALIKKEETMNQTMNVGTASFIAPEILRNAAFYDRKQSNASNNATITSQSSSLEQEHQILSSNNKKGSGKQFKSQTHKNELLDSLLADKPFENVSQESASNAVQNSSTTSTSSTLSTHLLYDERVDVFSFGIIMYCLLCGTSRPYGNLYDLDIIMKISTNKAFRPNLQHDAVQQALQLNYRWYIDLMERCWHWNPLERPSFDEIYSVLISKRQ